MVKTFQKTFFLSVTEFLTVQTRKAAIIYNMLNLWTNTDLLVASYLQIRWESIHNNRHFNLLFLQP